MLSGNPTHFSSAMQFQKEKAPKGHQKGYDQKDTPSTKPREVNTHKQPFVRLDSFEDYEIVDLEIGKDQSNSFKVSSDCSGNIHQGEKYNQMNFFNNRLYHPASYASTPYAYSNSNTSVNFRKQHQLQRPSYVAYQCDKSVNQVNACRPSLEILPNSQNYPYQSDCPGPELYNCATDQNFGRHPYGNSHCAEVTHHVPYNLTTGQYEYWMSMPGGGRNNSNREAMQAYCHNMISSPAKQLPAQISKTVSSFVGGIYDWVASSVDSVLKPNVSPSQNTSHIVAGQSISSYPLVKQLNPNAKEFTPQATLNPNAKEFLPSKMATYRDTSITNSNASDLTSLMMTSRAVENTQDMGKLSNSRREALQTPLISLEVTDVLNESDSDLSQAVIEQLIQEANKEQMEKENCGTENKNKSERSDLGLVTQPIEVERNQLQLKSVATRKTTPWVDKRQNRQTCPTEMGTSPLLHKSSDDEECPLDITEDSDTEAEYDDSDEDEFEESISPNGEIRCLNRIRRKSNRKQSASSCDEFEVDFGISERIRSLSTCSDDSIFIEFGSPSTSGLLSANCDIPIRDCLDDKPKKGQPAPINSLDSKTSKKLTNEKPKGCLLHTFVVRASSFVQRIGQSKEEDTETEVEQSDSDDEEDWDEIDGGDDCVDDELWQSFKAQVLMCPLLSNGSKKGSDNQNNEESDGDTPSNVSVNISFFLQNTSDQKSSNECGINPLRKTQLEIREANKKWNSFYNASKASIPTDTSKSGFTLSDHEKRNQTQLPDGNTKYVKIAPEDSFIIIFEDPSLSVELQSIRNGPYSCTNLARRKADKERMERLLSPIFKSDHRQRVWNRLQTNNHVDSENENAAS